MKKTNNVITNLKISKVFLNDLSDRLEALSYAVKDEVTKIEPEEIILAYCELKREIDILQTLTFESHEKIKQISQQLKNN